LLEGQGRAVKFPSDAILAGLVNAGPCAETLCEILDLTRACLDDHIVRLGLLSASERPARRRSARGWSPEDERNALLWSAAGVHPEAIGAYLSRLRSANAARTRLRRMDQASPRMSRDRLALPGAFGCIRASVLTRIAAIIGAEGEAWALGPDDPAAFRKAVAGDRAPREAAEKDRK
jgi:hypothetical protein